MQSMKQRIQNLSQNASTTFASAVFLSGWKEVMPVLYVIRNWGLTIALIANSVDSGWTVAVCFETCRGWVSCRFIF
ncbi:unnamed protein product [Prunus brigantina]